MSSTWAQLTKRVAALPINGLPLAAGGDGILNFCSGRAFSLVFMPLLSNTASSRNGFLETGLGGASPRECWFSGDTARLRNGLLDARFAPREDCASIGKYDQHPVYRTNAVARSLLAAVATRRHPETRASRFPVSHLRRRVDSGREILTCAIGERHCDVLTGTSCRRVKVLLKLEG